LQSPPPRAGSLSREAIAEQNTLGNRPRFYIKNRLSLIGFSGKEPEQKFTKNGAAYAVLSLATKTSWKNDNDEWETRTEWHRIIVRWNRTIFLTDFLFEASWRVPTVLIANSENAIVYTEYAMMETEKIGMREFRENLAGYLEAGKPLAITRHGETLGFYIPAQKRSRKAEVDAMRAAAKELDAMIAAWGASEDELIQEYKEIRRASREKKRNAR